MDRKMKIQWIVNIVLLVFTLLTLIVAVMAWFADNRQADVDNIQLTVTRKDLKIQEVTTIEFPYATKITDPSSESSFMNGAAVIKEYVIDGQGKLSVSVDCQQSGMLAYVFDDNDTVDYDVIRDALKGQLGENTATWTYEAMTEALNDINRRKNYGIFTDEGDGGDTHVKILYWVEYDAVKEQLESDDYVELNDSNGFRAIVTFVDEG